MHIGSGLKHAINRMDGRSSQLDYPTQLTSIKVSVSDLRAGDNFAEDHLVSWFGSSNDFERKSFEFCIPPSQWERTRTSRKHQTEAYLALSGHPKSI